MSQITLRHTNQLLGYPDDARLLIINVDDFGMCHAVIAAITRSLTAGVITSTTLMVPCAWSPTRRSGWLPILVAEDGSVAIEAEAAISSIQLSGDALKTFRRE